MNECQKAKRWKTVRKNRRSHCGRNGGDSRCGVFEGRQWLVSEAYIDKPEGVNIQDCENVSRALSDKLDEVDFIDDAYILELAARDSAERLEG